MFAGLAELNLIRFFDFYLAVAFLISTTLRVNQYRAVVGLVRAVPGRWPRLFKLVKEHSTIFLTGLPYCRLLLPWLFVSFTPWLAV